MKFPQREFDFKKLLVQEYFKHGSVDEAFRKNRYSLPISYAQYQRVLDEWGIVKAAGPNGKLAETLEFLSHMVHDNVSLEELYKKIPPSFQTSASTLYRILAYIKEGLTRRVGVALVLTPFDDNKKILIAKDVTPSRIELGKFYGKQSLPMGFSANTDSRKDGILRVLQNEVFTNETIDKDFPENIIPERPSPFMYLDIADVRVSVYHISLPKEFSFKSHFSSYKLLDFDFIDAKEILDEHKKQLYRVGVREAVTGYLKYLNILSRNLKANPFQERSLLNRELVATVEVLE